jgi:hypothetical protein
VTKFFEPSITHVSPSRRATVSIEPASEPLAGSVSAKHPSAFPRARRGSHSARCASVPKRRIGSHTSELWMLMITPTEAHAWLTSSIEMA